MHSRTIRLGGLAALITVMLGAQSPPVDLRSAFETITAKEMLRHIQILASDEFEGRAPGSRGEELTVGFLQEQYRRLNMKPVNPNGSFTQDVPLVGIKTTAEGIIKVGDKTIDLKSTADWTAVCRREAPESKVEDSEVVFVGYGVVAPEFGWDDYKGVDVKGKTIVMLVNDPAVPDPNDPAKLDDAMFKGKAMTYYGRWTYKYEIASEKGAAAAILVHETGPAGYPYQVVVGSWGRENFDLPAPDGNKARVAVESWMPLDKVKALFAAAGKDFDAMKKAAVSKEFTPVSLGARASFTARNTTRRINSKNVVGKLEGTDPKLKDQCVVYTAHWDHLGKDEALKGDQIYNGAADNASGVAMMLEIAEGFSRMSYRPARSIVFLAVTAEEKGLLGARYYAENPLIPLESTLADINMDVINLWGRTRDVTSVGKGNSTLDELFEEIARANGRTVEPDPEPEKGSFYRSDHFEFAKKGVPALNAKGGVLYIGKPADYGLTKRNEYTKDDYHKPSDEVKSEWDLSGAVEDARMLLEVGDRIARGATFPEWKPGTEFRKVREASLKKAAK
ncbi:MAG: putative aminopeptidase [Planctomycetota bacterium]|nr:putative aminopeptidase [Planctomycetota bacterium]